MFTLIIHLILILFVLTYIMELTDILKVIKQNIIKLKIYLYLIKIIFKLKLKNRKDISVLCKRIKLKELLDNIDVSDFHLKPFDCLQCMSFWCTGIYAFISLLSICSIVPCIIYALSIGCICSLLSNSMYLFLLKLKGLIESIIIFIGTIEQIINIKINKINNK